MKNFSGSCGSVKLTKGLRPFGLCLNVLLYDFMCCYSYFHFISHFRWCRHFGKPYSARTPTDDLMTKLSTSLFVSHIL